MEDLSIIKKKLNEFVFGRKSESGKIERAGLLDLRKKENFKDSREYQKLRERITTYIWKYAEIKFSNGIKSQNGKNTYYVDESGVGIMEFSRDFIENFEPESNTSDIFGYIYKGLIQKICSEGRKELLEKNRHGIRISENETDDSVDKTYRKLLKICEKNGKDILSRGVAVWLSTQIYKHGATEKNVKKIKDLIDSHSIRFAENEVKNKDGEIISIFDKIASPDNSEGTESFDEGKIQEKVKQMLTPILEKMDECYKNARPQIKKDGLLSAAGTLWFLEQFEKSKQLISQSFRSCVYDLVLQHDFVQEKPSRDLLDEWKNGENLIEQKELAKRLGRDASKVTAAIKKISGDWEWKNV